MLLVGIIGFGILNGWPAAIAALGNYPYQYAAVYDFSVIPLFVLMGNLGSVSGMARDLYSAAYAWIGHVRGGLAHATILACAGFAAVSGSSVASAVTMGKVCLPEMRRYNYSHRLATGVIAAGGTLGILIPPSTAFVLYGLLTEQSIGRLLLAGILPGIAAHRDFHDYGCDLDALQAAVRPARPAHELAGAQGQHDARAADDVDRAGEHRRHLRRHVHAHRGGGGRRRAGVRLCAVAQVARRRRALHHPGRDGQHHRAGVPDPDRRADLRAVPGAQRLAGKDRAIARRPRRAARRHPGPGACGLYRARHLPRRLLDAGADAADRHPDHADAWDTT